MSTSVKATRTDCFPTCVWQFDEPAGGALDNLLQRLKSAIEQERASDPSGMTNRSSVLGWHSQLNLHLREPFRPLMELMNRNLSAVIQFERWDLSKLTPIITECWAVVNGPQGSNHFHRHPHSHLSGVFYVQAPPQCGSLMFRDPRPVVGMMAPPVTQRTPWNQLILGRAPQTGRMLIFPSWLEHGVGPNESSQDRIAIRFNATFRPKTASLVGVNEAPYEDNESVPPAETNSGTTTLPTQ